MSNDSVPVKCDACGSLEFEYPTNPADEDVVRCARCHRVVGKYADVKVAMAKIGKDFVSKIIEDSLGVKPTEATDEKR
jgi:hypothetical protein